MEGVINLSTIDLCVKEESNGLEYREKRDKAQQHPQVLSERRGPDLQFTTTYVYNSQLPDN